MFIRDAWYVAALDRDLTDKLMAVTLLGDCVVLYRLPNGTPVALEDACAHRKLPLSMGRIKGDQIECGYHGLRFNAAGKCTHIPCSHRIPKAARVHSYPIVSRYGLLWIWMGRPELAEPQGIMAVSHWGESGWAVTDGDTMTVDCNYLFMTDNLLDPSHVAWVHPSSFGDVACEATAVHVRSTKSGIQAVRWMRSTAVAPLYRAFVRFEGLCDRLQHYEVQLPCHALVKAVFVPAGCAGPDAEQNELAFVMDSYNFLTPVDEDHTRYFWFQVHNAAANSKYASCRLADGVRGAFEEDRAVLSAVHRNSARTRTGHIDIPIDSAPLRFRRKIKHLLEAESAVSRAEDAAPSLRSSDS